MIKASGLLGVAIIDHLDRRIPAFGLELLPRRVDTTWPRRLRIDCARMHYLRRHVGNAFGQQLAQPPGHRLPLGIEACASGLAKQAAAIGLRKIVGTQLLRAKEHQGVLIDLDPQRLNQVASQRLASKIQCMVETDERIKPGPIQRQNRFRVQKGVGERQHCIHRISWGPAVAAGEGEAVDGVVVAVLLKLRGPARWHAASYSR